MDAAEEMLLDDNAMAEGKDFFQVGDCEVSQDNRLLAWADDTVGRRQYTMRVKDLATGEILDDDVPNVEANLVWADDNSTLFYVENDPETLLSKRVKTHVLGTPAAQDRAGLRGEGRQLLHGHRPHARRPVHLHQRRQHGQQRVRCTPAGGLRASSPCSRRARATSSTRPTTSAAAG